MRTAERVSISAFVDPDDHHRLVERARADFLDEHWGDAAPATRRNRLAIVKSFFRFCCEERGLETNPAERIKPPKRASVERQAYAPDVIRGTP
jgi:site-specific recombinase XerD